MNGKVYSFRVLFRFALVYGKLYDQTHQPMEIEFINNSQPISFYCKVKSCLSIEFCASNRQKVESNTLTHSDFYLFIFVFAFFTLSHSFSFFFSNTSSLPLALSLTRSFSTTSSPFILCLPFSVKCRKCIMHFACLQQLERFFGRWFGF